MRAFIAIELPASLRAALSGLMKQLQAEAIGARWVQSTGLHVTLRFLGDCDEKTLGKIGTQLVHIARKRRPFTLCFRSVGFFPRSRSPRVLWVGVSEPPALLELQSEIEQLARSCGASPERRVFHPHVTLARFRRPRPQARLSQAVSSLENRSLGSFKVDAIFLFESRLEPGGAIYLERARAALA